MKSGGNVIVKREVLVELGETLFAAYGLSSDDANTASRILVNSDARGVESHGFARLPVYLDRIENGGSSATAQPTIEREFGAIATVNGNNALGLITGTFAMKKAISLAQSFGIGAVSVKGSGHYGPAAEYALLGTAHRCITLSTTNVNTSMAPWGSITPLLGNNPIAIAAPTSHHPYVLDMALSTVARGKIRLAAARGDEIPIGWGLDAQGIPTTDAKAALEGLITPLGGPKGSGLAIAVDILCAVLSGSPTSPEVLSQAKLDRPQNVSHFFIAIHIPAFTEFDRFVSDLDAMLDRIRGSKQAANVNRIYAPGDIENEHELEANRSGIKLQVSTWAEIKKHTDRKGIPMPEAVILI